MMDPSGLCVCPPGLGLVVQGGGSESCQLCPGIRRPALLACPHLFIYASWLSLLHRAPPPRPVHVCTEGTFKGMLGNFGCDGCPLSTMTTKSPGATSVAMCVCMRGYFMIEGGSEGNTTCTRCAEEGTHCNTSGILLKNIPLLPDFWRMTPLSTDIRRCYSQNACNGGTNVSEFCSEGREGPVCDNCISGYDKNVDDECSECGSSGGVSPISMVAVGLLGLAIVSVLVRRLVPRNGRLAGAVRSVSETLFMDNAANDKSSCIDAIKAWLEEKFTILGKFAVRMRILASFLQVLTALGVVFDMPHLDLFSSVTRSLAFVNIDWIGLTSLGCVIDMNFHRKLILRTATPLLVVVVVGTLHLLNRSWLRQER